MQAFRIPAPARKVQLRVRQETHVLRKWVGIGALVGLTSGIAAVGFLWLIKVFSTFFLGWMAGYSVPETGGPFVLARPWVLPLVPALGGLVGGFLVWRLAPDASGIGTDAAIKAFHQERPISIKTTLVKLVTSAITIGSGGSSGREGPIAQVGAGTGSNLARWLKLSTKEHGIALAAGLGAGIAAMFKAPLAGTIIAAEVFYREDFEVEALVPTLVAAVVGYSVVGFAFGWQPVFNVHVDPFTFGQPAALLLYAVVGVACGLLARFAIGWFYAFQGLFRRMPLMVSTTLGGLLVGMLALLLVMGLGIAPVLGTGAPWLQAILDHAPIGNGVLPLAPLFLAAAVAELAGITLTIGSGGSGGIFGPSLVVGGFLGAAFGVAFGSLFPSIAPDFAPYAIVGMIAYFAGAAKAPLGTIVMVVEMTGGYGLLGPAMVATMFAFLLSGHGSMFASQVRNRLASPAHASEYEATILHQHKVEQVMHADPVTATEATAVSDAVAVLQKTEAFSLPVLRGDQLVGMVTLRELQRLPEAERPGRTVGDVLSNGFATVTPQTDLFEVLAILLDRDVNALPVVEARAAGRLVGLVTRRDVSRVVQEARKARPTTAWSGLTKAAA